MTSNAGRRYTDEVLIVGGGTMGLFLALWLAQAGKQVTVVDRSRVWSEASGVNAGSLAVQNKMIALIPYTLEATRMWAALPELLGADVGYHCTGGYKIATSPEEVERLRKSYEQQRSLGVPLTWFDGEELTACSPWLSSGVLAASECSIDGHASPTLLGPVLRRAVIDAGVTVLESQAVQAMSMVDQRYVVQTDKSQIVADSLILAAGAWTGVLAAMLDVRLQVALDVNIVSVTEPAPKTIGCIVTHTRGILTLKQVDNGTCLIGGGWQGSGTLLDGKKAVDLDQLTHNMRLAVSVVPGLAPLHVVRSWAGYEGVSPDSLPYLGRLPGHQKAYVAACARGGFTLGPLLAKLLSEHILTGDSSMPINCFDPSRFSHV